MSSRLKKFICNPDYRDLEKRMSMIEPKLVRVDKMVKTVDMVDILDMMYILYMVDRMNIFNHQADWMTIIDQLEDKVAIINNPANMLAKFHQSIISMMCPIL